ncbi:MAG: thiamine phosphate synthase [Terriglobales bacterium]
MHFPRLYAILDTACFPDVAAMFAAAEDLAAAGVTLLQYRNKSGNARQMLDHARQLKRRVGARVTLIMNDRADLCLAADFDGLHLGQDDLSPESARRIIGASPLAANQNAEAANQTAERANRNTEVAKQNAEKLRFVSGYRFSDTASRSNSIAPLGAAARWLGVSTHNPEQLAAADKTPADYLAIGPVFATSSKANPDPVVGLEGVRRARQLTSKPLVAIGGITRANAPSVIEAGADAVAVISDLLRDPRKSAEEFLRILS